MLCAQSLVGDETLVARVLGAVGSAGVRFLKVFKFNQRLFTHFLSLCCYCWCTMTLKIGSHLRQVKHLNNVLQQWVSFSSLEHFSDYQWKQRDIMMPVWFVSLFTVKKRVLIVFMTYKGLQHHPNLCLGRDYSICSNTNPQLQPVCAGMPRKALTQMY